MGLTAYLYLLLQFYYCQSFSSFVNTPLSKDYAISIKANQSLYQAYKSVLKNRGMSVTDDIEKHMLSVIGEQYQDSDVEKLKSAMDFIYPEWRQQ